ncbi:Lipoyl synthase [Anaplasma phagocytophilum]|nr:Lipoyl synthase [Anaplasma phagocytophilum]SBO32892.1 Lipoyl synthase [Anaplasma phagocytophilum]SBO32995.1 Lipoyl synthase [Anaplasma phagocytophilum]SCV64274.1 Lipoyl synthase [Anaplasma phagocytophilum]
MFTKSGLMLGLGEQEEELTTLWRILGVRGLTFCLGAVLAKDNTDVHRYVTPEEFEQYKHMAHTKGFSMVASSPLAQPSHYGVITNFIGLKSMYSKNKSVLI